MNVSHSTSRPAPPPLGYLPLASTINTPAPETVAEVRNTPAPEGVAELRAALLEVTHGLQLSRASTMALMRLQLALRSGDRVQALEAVDRLNLLDAELEGVVARLAPPDDSDETLHAIAKLLEAQKLSLAFEKLALASGIVGPGLVSIENAWPASEEPAPTPETGDAQMDEAEDARELPDLTELWSTMDQFEPERPRGISPKIWGLIATLLLMMAAAGAFLLLR